MHRLRLSLALVTALVLTLPAAQAPAAGGDPTTAAEQQFIYELNLMRWNPWAYGIGHLTGRQYPVAVNGDLAAAAHFRAQEMIDLGYQSHTSPSGEWPNGVARRFGFPLPEWWDSDANYIEALWASSGEGWFPPPTVFTLSDNPVYPDITLSRPGTFYQFHREVGVGYAEGNGNGSRLVYMAAPRDGSETEWSLDLPPRPPYFITGVVFDDGNGNGRMDLGEGRSGVTVSSGAGSKVTNAGGGYSILANPGTYTVSVSGAGSGSVTVADQNVGVDFVVGRSVPIIRMPASAERWAGADRFQTAVVVSQQTHQKADTVYLAVGTNYPDAIAAGPAAGAEGAPILLTHTDSLPAVTRDELKRLAPSQVVVVGGPAAVSEAVLQQVRSLLPGRSVVRRHGATRFETAVEISKAVFQQNSNPTVYITTGYDFADAVATSPAAIHDAGPVLLVTPTAIPPVVAQELDRLRAKEIIVVGGPAAVSDGVLQALKKWDPTVERITGPNRYSVSANVSQATFSAPAEVVYVAVGDKYPDALAGGPATAVVPGPILLVPSWGVPDAVRAELLRLAPHRIVILGGTAVVPDSVARQLSQYVS